MPSEIVGRRHEDEMPRSAPGPLRDLEDHIAPKFAVRITRGLVTHWNNEPLLTWEQADECRQRIEELQHESGTVERVLLSV